MSRGVRGELIFQEASDYHLFMILVKECQKKYGFKVHSYCLMSNHFHMLIETGQVKIGTIMERMLKSYSNNFNRKYSYNGHVFQGRYKGILIENPNYFLATGRYIHLNPVKAHMVQRPEDYEFSSYRYYLSGEANEILDQDKTLSFFQDSDPLEYAQFVEARNKHDEYEQCIMSEMGEDDAGLPW